MTLERAGQSTTTMIAEARVIPRPETYDSTDT